MNLATTRRTADYKPALAWFAAVGTAWVFVLVALGAFTTSIGAGMVFPDWPLSNGSLNPDGWLSDVYMFAEHSHRLTGAVMGLITLTLAIWISRREERRWLRALAWWALAAVVIQGIIGGQRVRLDGWHILGMPMTVGQLLRIPHGILAHIYICLLIAIAVSLSRPWLEHRFAVSRRIRIAGSLSCLLILVQLGIAVVMRHNQAGLAIRTFPLSTETGALLPDTWAFPVAIHFAHRAMAVVLGAVLIAFALMLRLDASLPKLMRAGGNLLIVLLIVQITLGAQIIWTLREPGMTTGHVVVAALLLALTFWLTWLSWHAEIQRNARP
jgi:cytochrome c oxidase assembly protein subunit 15